MPIGRPAAELPPLSQEEILRYSRHLIIPEVGVEGQRRLKDARVLMVGAGGLGSPIGLYLAAAGVGRLGIVEFDVVDETNLQRQLLHGTKDVGRKKLDSARDRIRDVNPHVEVVPHETRLTSDNALEIIRQYDLVVDGTDNFATRYLVNDACVLLGKPNVYGSIFRFEGQSTVFCTKDGPCYRCLYPRAAAAGARPVLRGGRRARHPPGARRRRPGDGDREAHRRDRRAARRAPAARRRALDAVPDGEAPQGPALPGLRHAGAQGARGLRAVLRDPRRRGRRPSASRRSRPPSSRPGSQRGDALDLVDVREPHEWDICRIDGARLAPLSSFAESLRTLDSARDVVLYCRSGVRSAKALRQLQAAGFKRVWNLAGGILRWSDDVDPSIPKY